MRLSQFHNLHDFEATARRKLPRAIFSYIQNGAEDEVTLRRNRSSFDHYAFVPNMLHDVSQRDQAITLFGHTYDSAFGISPVGLGALYHYRGDIALATAAHQRNVPYVLSGASLTRLEDVAKAAPRSWFQAYLPGSDFEVRRLLERVANAGFGTLVITVDLPVSVNPDRYVRNGFSSPLRPSIDLALQGVTRPGWLFGTFLRMLVAQGMPHLENWRAERGAPVLSRTVLKDVANRDTFTWQHIEQARGCWKGNLVIKGILSAQDARRCAQIGVDGIIVSNHGGRQVDGAVAAIDALPEIVRAVPELVVMMDSGIRRGADVLKAIALGARCVFAGRPFNFALASAGAAGVTRALELLHQEVHRNMALLGIEHPYQLTPEMLRVLARLERVT